MSWIIALHGGAGSIGRDDLAPARAALAAALEAGRAILRAGGPALDAVVAAVESLEASGEFNAGRGAVRAADGSITLDAAVMDGPTRAAGAVAALGGFVPAVRVARLVMERTPHVLLAGAGAEAFAAGCGLVPLPPGEFTPVGAGRAPRPPGTVGAVARDTAGRLAAATATGGVVGKLPGRVGDSPVIGAGTWADGRCAVSATGLGEAFVRAVFGHQVSARLGAGASLAEATRAALDDVTALGGSGGCVAVDARGEVALPFTTAGMFRGRADEAGLAVGVFPGEGV